MQRIMDSSMHTSPLTGRGGVTYWCGDKPVDVADVEYFSVDAGDFWVAAFEFYLDCCVAEIRSHCEVGDTGDEGYGCGDVVEYSVSAWDGKTPGEDDDGYESHQGRDGPVHIRSMSGKTLIHEE